MTADDVWGWRDRAIALAGLGAAALSRSAFATLEDADPPPLQMQVLVAIALEDSMLTDPPRGTGTDWLSIALHIEQDVVEQLLARLVDRNLVVVQRETGDEILWDLDVEEDEDVARGEGPIMLTDDGRDHVDRWLRRVRWRFAGWPAPDADVDDAIG
jgi:hypothetical protein